MTGYIELAPGPLGRGLEGAARLFRRAWPALLAERETVGGVVRPGRHKGWGPLEAKIAFDQPWTSLGPLSRLEEQERRRLIALADLTLEVFYVVSSETAEKVAESLSGAERKRQEGIVDLPLLEAERAVLDSMVTSTADRGSLLVGTADEANMVYVFGSTALLPDEQARR